MRICVLGLGQVGLPTANYILKKGFEVWGYDIDPIVAKKAKEEGILKATSNWREIPPVDVYIVCVSTTLNGDMPDLTPVFDVCKKISQIASSSSLISIESTIMPGTSKIIYEDIFKENNNLIHVPHRFWVEDQTKHGVKQLRVIGAMNHESLKKGHNFYQNIRIDYSQNITIYDSIFSHSEELYGLTLSNANNNTIRDNQFAYNGIEFHSSHNNTIIGNDIIYSNGSGIGLRYSDDNVIRSNNTCCLKTCY